MIKHNPNGPKKNKPNRIIVHAMSEYLVEDGEALHASDFLEKHGLSAHALVTPDGEIITCRYDDEGAWHAKGYNTDSLGIEFLVEGLHTYTEFLEAMKTNYVTSSQWNAGVDHIIHWVENHPIERIDRHSDVDPARKFDPGQGFDWERFMAEFEHNGYTGLFHATH